MTKHLLFIVNPFSGISNKSNLKKLLDEELDKSKFTFDVIYTAYPNHAKEIVKNNLDNFQNEM